MARKAATAVKKPADEMQGVLAAMPRSEDILLPVADPERALFAACFGRMIEQILAEPD